MFLIVLAHVIQSLRGGDGKYIEQDIVIPLASATMDFQQLSLSLLQYSGVFGNAIFFVSSAWLLLDSEGVKLKKVLRIIVEMWFASMLILIATLVFFRENVGLSFIYQSFFPITFSRNWYITCYVLLYVMHGCLNKVISCMSRRKLLTTSILLSFFYIVVPFVKSGLLYANDVMVWVAVYFCIAYVKKYNAAIFTTRKLYSWILVLLGFLGNAALVVFVNFLGLHFSTFSNGLLYWYTRCNPFQFIAAMGLFGLASQLELRSVAINKLSGLTILVYILHENTLCTGFVRPWLINCMYGVFGAGCVLAWVLATTIIIFVVGFILNYIYRGCTNKVFSAIVEWIDRQGNAIYAKLPEDR